MSDVIIIPPEITEEERKKRIQQIKEVIIRLLIKNASK